MSATHRSIARLPLDIFDNLITRPVISSSYIVHGTNNDSIQGHNKEKAPSYVYDDNAPPPAVIKTTSISASDLRNAICSKLKKFSSKKFRGGGYGDRNVSNSNTNNNNNTSNFDSITTVGGLLTRISTSALLRILDPLLTYEECEELIRRTCLHCSPPPKSALSLLQETEEIPTIQKKIQDIQEKRPQQQTQGIQQRQDSLYRSKITSSSMIHKITNHVRYLPTGLESLDECLRGGIRIGTITELVGRAGAGKTQLAMQLCVTASKYNQGCIYVDTEKKLSLIRLQEIAQTRFAAHHHHHHHHQQQQQRSTIDRNTAKMNFSYQSPHQVLQNISIHSNVTTTKEMLSLLANLEEEILLRREASMEAFDKGRGDYGLHDENHFLSSTTSLDNNTTFPVRLVILDSIAAPTRRDFGSHSAPQRAAAIFQCAQIVKRLAHELQVAVVVINQVAADQKQEKPSQYNDDRLATTNSAVDFDHQSTKTSVKAALGTSWHHCVTTRILMEHNHDPHRLDSSSVNSNSNSENNVCHTNDRGRIRTASIVKSNLTGFLCTQFEVTSSGLTEVTTRRYK